MLILLELLVYKRVCEGVACLPSRQGGVAGEEPVGFFDLREVRKNLESIKL